MHADAVGASVLQTFENLPQKAKPRVYENGIREWTVLAGLTLSDATSMPICVALGTGMRCLPFTKLPIARGNCLHDWHAEVVAMRAFNAYLINECMKVSEGQVSSQWLYRKTDDELLPASPQPFRIKDGVRIDMYCSEAPCGDASMELVMQSQMHPEPWSHDVREDGPLDGHAHFSQLGVVRRKPARADAPMTRSKSCSDKLALKQCTSLLVSLTSLFIEPNSAYLSSIILPADQLNPISIDRCFGPSGRLSCLSDSGSSAATWSEGYAFQCFDVEATTLKFEFSRPTIPPPTKLTGSNITAAWTPDLSDVIISGTKSGFKQFSARGQSFVCRKSLWQTCLRLAAVLESKILLETLEQPDYLHVKTMAVLSSRQRVKEHVRGTALVGWIRNTGDDDFSLVVD